jgi:hypothetical protein
MGHCHALLSDLCLDTSLVLLLLLLLWLLLAVGAPAAFPFAVPTEPAACAAVALQSGKGVGQAGSTR